MASSTSWCYRCIACILGRPLLLFPDIIPRMQVFTRYLLINLKDTFSTRPSDRTQIWHACADRDETGSHQKKNLTQPTPGGFTGLSIDVCGMCDVCLWVCGLMFVGCVWRPPDRAQIWHACADRYSHLKKKFDPAHPRGFRGLSIVKNLLWRTAPKFGTHVRIDTLTFKKKISPTPPQRGLGGYLSIVKNLSRWTTPKFGTHVQRDTLTLKKFKNLPTPPQGGLGG